MHGIVSLLDTPSDEKVMNIWGELEVFCQLEGIKITPIPHFSWQLANEYDFSQLESILEEMAQNLSPFKVRTGGLALFTGNTPVIYMPIVRDRFLSKIHESIWEKAGKIGIGMCDYYSPERWIPHITLAHGDVGRKAINCIMEKFAFRSTDWEVVVDNLAVMYQTNSQVGTLKRRYPFEGQP
jgi:2'-5' RNA ligase